MSSYRTAWIAPPGPRWIRRRVLRASIRLAALLPLFVFVAAHELDLTSLELSVVPLLPATAIAFSCALVRFVVTTCLHARLPRKRTNAGAAPVTRTRDLDRWTHARRWDGRSPE